MKKIFLMLVIAGLCLSGCRRNGLDSEVHDGDPGYIDSKDGHKGDSTRSRQGNDTTRQERPDSVLPRG